MEQTTPIARLPRPRLPPPRPRLARHHRRHRATRLPLPEALDRNAPVRRRATAFFQPQARPHIAPRYVSPVSRYTSLNPWKAACVSPHPRRVTAVVAAPPVFPGNTVRSPRYHPAWHSGTPAARSVRRKVLIDWSASPHHVPAVLHYMRARHNF